MRSWLPVAVFLALGLVGCGDAGGQQEGDGSSASTPTESPEPSASASATPTGTGTDERRGRVVTTDGSDFGTMLFDRSGQAIYLFAKERTRTPECYGACAEAWPPVLTRGEPQASGEVRPALLGVTERKDGSQQVTYAGHPLYYYAHEGKNQVLCHNVSEYGGLWLVVTPSGEPAP
jgi:predicted lipoprotein with Yx(FWY)xxD motif